MRTIWTCAAVIYQARRDFFGRSALHDQLHLLNAAQMQAADEEITMREFVSIVWPDIEVKVSFQRINVIYHQPYKPGCRRPDPGLRSWACHQGCWNAGAASAWRA